MHAEHGAQGVAHLAERGAGGEGGEDLRHEVGGAVRGALWLKGKKPGLYGMKDVLGL